jgi:ammonia channel protein AmtB
MASSIRFRKGGSVRKAARKANIRVILIGVVLLWITWKMIVWAETTEFGKMLEFIRDNG